MPTFKTKAEQDQYNKTLAMFGGVKSPEIPQGLKDLGYVSADPLEIASYNQEQVPFLSTENAVETANKNLTKLNQYSPATAPGYVPPTPTATETTKPKTLKFVNEDGQTITLSEQDALDQSTVDRLKEGGYVFSEGDGVVPPKEINKPKKTKTGLGLSGESAEQIAAQDAQDRLDRQVKEFNNWVPEDDPAFQAIADGIRAQYQQYKVQMQKTNDARAKAYETAGIRGGTAEFAGNIQRSIEGGELDQANARIAELTRQENAAIIAARSAYETEKWTQFNKQIDLLEKRREEKMQILKEYNDTLAKNINAAREKEIQASRDSAVANLIAQGVTDPITMLDYLNYDQTGKLVGDFTAEEIGDVIKNITGNYGSGIVGEYNFYKAEEKAAGREPLSFDAYQTRDANRKIAASNAVASINGLNTSQLAALDKKNTWLASQPTVKDFQTIQGKYMDVIKAIKQGGGAADIAIIYDLMKALDPTSVVRTEEYNTGASKSGNIFAGAYAKYNGYLDPKGGFVSDGAKLAIQGVMTNLYENKRREYTNIRNQVVKDLENRKIPDADAYVYDYDLHADVINEENFTEDDLKSFYQQNENLHETIDKIITENPSLSPYEVYQIANSL
jgi:hypothetical protein